MAPTFRRGFPSTCGLVIAALTIIVGIHLLALRERKKNPGMDTENGSDVGVSVDESGSDMDGKTAAIVQVRNSREIGEGAGDKKDKL